MTEHAVTPLMVITVADSDLPPCERVGGGYVVILGDCVLPGHILGRYETSEEADEECTKFGDHYRLRRYPYNTPWRNRPALVLINGGAVMKLSLIFASGPSPADSEDARTLGYEERKLGELLDADAGTVRMWCHAASVPELVAFVRAVGRDCSFRVFATRQALLIVEARD